MRFSVKGKLLLGFGLILVFMLGMGIVSYYTVEQLDEKNRSALAKLDEIIFLVETEVDHLAFLNSLSSSFLFKQAFTGQLDHTQCRIGQWYYGVMRSEEFNMFSPQLQESLRKLDEPHRLLHQSARDIVNINNEYGLDSEEGWALAFQIYQNQTLNHITGVRNAISEIRTYMYQEKDVFVKAAQDQGELSQRLLLIVTGVAIVLGIFAALLINRIITKPINEVVAFLQDMAQSGGDLTRRIVVNSKDELGDLAYWFNAFVTKLHDIIFQVKGSAMLVSSSSNELSSGNQELSQRTEEQASSLEEVSSTIQEITATLQNTTGNSNEADRLSRETLVAVQEGEKVVTEMEVAMKDITTGSKEIAEIISTVNDIAFQTNLLALNAAVEAARAGEQGRGFAVVAAEVRNLAGRTAESAKEIEGLIKDSIQRVERGNMLMAHTKQVLERIVVNNQQATDVVGEIAAAMREQSAAASDIRGAIDELNQVTQHNASLVEEIASSSEAMSGESEELYNLVSQFKLEDSNVSKQVNSEKKNKLDTKPAPKAPKKAIVGNSNRNSQESKKSDSFDLSEDDFEKF